MAEKYGVHVLGVDLATHMINIANERLEQTSEDVQSKVSVEEV